MSPLTLAYATQSFRQTAEGPQYTELHTLNPNLPFFGASIAKLFIAGATLAEATAGHLSLNESLPSNQSDYTVRQAITRMLSIIDNQAPIDLTARIGRQTITTYLKNWGITHTTLYDEKTGSKNSTTASDVVILLKQAWERKLAINEENTSFFWELLTHSDPRVLTLPPSIHNYQKGGEMQSIRQNTSVLHAAGVFYDAESGNGGIYCFLSKSPGFWRRSHQAKKLQESFNRQFPELIRP